MKAIFTQSGPGLSIGQGGLGPIVTLGFGTSGAPASIGTAPVVDNSDPADMVAIRRAGELQLIPSDLFAEGLNGASLADVLAAVGPTLTVLGLGIGNEVTRAEAAEAAAELAISGEAQARANGDALLSAGLAAAALLSGAVDPVTGAVHLQTAGGGSVPIAGVFGITAVSTTVTSTGLGGSTTGAASVSNGTLALSIGIPLISGPAGAVATVPGGLGGTFNPATGVTSNGTTLGVGGVGAAPNTILFASAAGTSSLTGTPTVYAVGDMLCCTGAGNAFFFRPGQAAQQSAPSFVSPNAATPGLTWGFTTDGTNDFYIKDGSGKFAAVVVSGTDGSSQIAYVKSNLGSFAAAQVDTLSAGSLTVSTSMTIGPAMNVAWHADGTNDWFVGDGKGVRAISVDGPTGLVTMGHLNLSALTVAGVAVTGGGGSSSTTTTVLSGSGGVAPFVALANYDTWEPVRLWAGTYHDDSPGTWHSIWNFEAPVDAVRLVYGYDTANASSVTIAKVALSASGADPLNPVDSSGAPIVWATVTFGNGGACLPVWQQPDPPVSTAGSITLATNTGSIYQEAQTFSDTVFLPYVARTDNKTGTLLYVRSLMAGAVRSLNISEIVDPDTVLGSRSAGSYYAAGDYVTNTAGMPNGGLYGFMIPSGVMGLARQRGVAILGVGASMIGGGATTDSFNTLLPQTMVALSNSPTPITIWNAARAAAGTLDFIQRAHTVLNWMQFPFVIITTWSINDGYGPVQNNQAATTALMEQGWQRSMALAWRVNSYGGKPILLCTPPKNINTMITENARLAIRQRNIASGFDYLDIEALVSNGGAPASLLPQYTSGTDSDLNDAGHALMVPLLTAIIKKHTGQ